MRLVATKSLRYNTRRLLPGDEFEAVTDRDGRLLIGVRKAKKVKMLPSPSVPQAKQVPADLLSAADQSEQERSRADAQTPGATVDKRRVVRRQTEVERKDYPE